MYFAHLQPPTLQDAACSLGLSGNSAGVLGRLWRALRGAEARWTQSNLLGSLQDCYDCLTLRCSRETVTHIT